MEEEKDPTMKDLMRAIVETRAEVREIHGKIDAHHAEAQASSLELAEAIQMLATNTDEQFTAVRRDTATKADVQQAKHEILDRVDRKVDRVDEKANKTVDVLKKNNVITSAQAAFVLNV